MQTRKLGTGGLEVSALGFGCMGMSWSYGPPKDKKEMTSLQPKPKADTSSPPVPNFRVCISFLLVVRAVIDSLPVLTKIRMRLFMTQDGCCRKEL